MGRHSAPGEDTADDSAVATTATPDAGTARGRHSRRDEENAGGPSDSSQDDQLTQMITIIDPDVKVDDTQVTGELPPVPAQKPSKAPKQPRGGESNTQADLRLLRESTAVRAQVLAAVIASFVLYTVVMLVIGKTSSYVLWIWIPIVVAGVGVGAVLDAAHRRVKRRAPEPPAQPPAQEAPTSQT